MKKLALTLCLAALTTGAFAQGLVNFFNNASTQVSAGGAVTPATAGTYYFGLFTAPIGSVDFTFAGILATNQASAGRFTGGASVAVPGWAAGTQRQFQVAGWSSALGTDVNAILGYAASGMGPANGWFGKSAIATGTPGGFDGTGTLPNLNIFGSTAIPSGFNLGTAISVIPEPSSLALLGLGAAALLIRRRK